MIAILIVSTAGEAAVAGPDFSKCNRLCSCHRHYDKFWMMQRYRPSIFAFFLYLLLSLFYFGKSASLANWYLGDGEDPIQFIWFMDWYEFAISHHLNPLISRYIWFPQGFNLTWTTSVPTAAILMLPLTWAAGPIVSYNLLLLMAPALSAWAAFRLAHHLTRDWPAALAGGYIFGFSTYELGQMFGHLNLSLTFLVPVIILLCVKHAQDGRRRFHFILALSLALLGELGLSAEILATLCVFGALSWGIFFAFAEPGDRPNMRRLAIDIAAAAAIATVLAAPFLFYMVKGLNATSPIPESAVSTFSAELINYIVPTQISEFGWKMAAGLAHRFTGNLAEQGAYLGLPLIFLMAQYFHDQFHRQYVRALLVATIMLGVLSLGPWLQFAGRSTALPLPWLVATQLPLIRLALPARFSMYVSLCAALAIALWLANSAGRRKWRFAFAAFSCILLAPNMTAYGWGPWTAWTRWPAREFFAPDHVGHILGPSPNVLILPFGSLGDSLAWQVESGFRFTMAGGYLNIMPKSETGSSALVEQLYTGTADADFMPRMKEFCTEHHVTFILLTPDAPAVQISAIEASHWPQVVDRNVIVVAVPRSF